MDSARPVSLRTKAVAVLVSLALALAALELTARVAIAIAIGPGVILYGIVDDRDEQAVQRHDNVVEGRYSKYFPHQHRRDVDVDTGESFVVRINAQGFRGEDFAREKRRDTIRIVTLGASSTFGYHDRDDETYPVFLERFLAEACPGPGVEVINLGIPHLDAAQIHALFMDEALPLHPDVVTFYEGINDSQGGGWRAPVAPSLRSRVRRAIREHVLLAALLAELGKPRSFGTAEVAAHREGRIDRFLESVARIQGEARRRGIEFVAVTQQAQSGSVPRERMRGVPYAAEVARIEQRLTREGAISAGEMHLLTHDDLMRALRRWAAEQGVPLVDGIAALDQRRDTMVSWVHLNAEGNRILARAMADRIAPLVCSLAPSARTASAEADALR